jgi:SAM-dependent methyltransferase
MTRQPAAEKNWLAALRRDWDSRARENARAYINWPGIANEESAFFLSGQFDYDRYVKPFLAKMQFDPADKVALEIGCGIGRIARSMTGHFREYIGVDVSPEMIRKAASYGIPHATFRAVSGADLAGIPAGSIDFVFSFAVFQHVPDKAAIFNYFAETARVLRHGGIFRLHMKGLWCTTIGRLALEAGFSNNARLLKAHLTRVPLIRFRYLDTWQGHSIAAGEAVKKCESLGLEVLEVEDKWTTMMWVGGRKR